MMTAPLVPHCRLTRRRLALAGLLTSTAVLAGTTIATPAFAATPTATTKAELASQINAAPAGTTPTEIVLGASLTASDASHDTLVTPDGSTITLDLDGQRLSLQRLTVGQNATLLITDSTSTGERYSSSSSLRVTSSSGSTAAGIVIGSGATLHVDATQVSGSGSEHAAGIGSPAGLTAGAGQLLVTDGASVSGRGGAGGAGIGGAEGAAAISVTSTDSSVDGDGGVGGAGIGSGRDGVSAGSLTTDTTPNTTSGGDYSDYHYSYVSASGGSGAAGLGGGLRASGGTVRLSGNSSTYATAGRSLGSAGAPSAVGAGQTPRAATGTFGSLEIGRDAYLNTGTGSALLVPADAVVKNDGQIGLGGTASGAGTITNQGSIRTNYFSSAGSTQVDPGSRVTVDHVTGHNYLVTLDPNGGTSTGYTSTHVFTSSFDIDDLPEPTAPVAGQVLLGWNTRPDGSGDDLDSTSLEDLTGDTSRDGTPLPLTIYAQYGVLPHFTASTLPAAGLGATYDQPVPVAGDGISGYWVSTEDEDGNDIAGLPAGLSLDSETGHINGTPTEAGTFRFRLWVWGKRSASGYLTISIAGAPVIATSALPAAQQGSAYSTQLSATGEGSITWSAGNGGLPQGLSVSAGGVLSGTPTGSGSSTVSVVASSEYGPTARTFTLDVAAAPVSASAAAPVGGSTTAAVTSASTPAAATAPAPAAAAPAAAKSAGTTAAPAAVATAAPLATTTPTPAIVAAAPVLASVPRTTVRFGHRLDLSLAASSTAPVTYSIAGDLPSGVSLHRSTGLISGVPTEVGTFTSTVTATSSAGAAKTAVVIVVPEVKELIDAKAIPAVKVGVASVPVIVSGFKKGERWRLQMDGKVVRSGIMKRAGTLKTKLTLKAAKHDTVHRIVISGSRKVSDPAQRASTDFTVTSLAAKKHLAASASTSRTGAVTVKVAKLAASEHVVVKEKKKVIAKGVADAAGRFSFVSKKLAKGVHTLLVRGATAGRTDTLKVKSNSH